MNRAELTKTHLSIPELAARWGVCQLTIRRRIKRGEIRCLRLGRQLVRIEIEEIERIEREARGR
ncbi:MAG: helix-turn-helix domain-containing protein [Verrucomicrobiales bacterium]|nr:helix-turn-helix domain-containing protein [Verrucomicrobiales bacterium]